MKIKVDNVNEFERDYLKEHLLKIENRLNVAFTSDKAIITLVEPYYITDAWLNKKSFIKKQINNFLNEFRKYQFTK